MVLLAALAVGCDSQVSAPRLVTSLSLTSAKDSIVIGETKQLTATALDTNGAAVAGAVIRWSSSNPEVAAVSASGVVTPRTPGTVSVTAESNGKSARTTVVAYRVATTVTLVPATIPLGEATTVVAVARDATGAVVFDPSSIAFDDPSAATLSAGIVTGLKAGRSGVTVTIGGRKLLTTLEVGPPHVQAIVILLDTAIVAVGTHRQLDFTVKVVSGATVTWPSRWSSSNSAVVSVIGDGELVGIAAGIATVKGESEGKSDSVVVRVFQYDEPLTFRSVSMGQGHGCGLSGSGRAYCWGSRIGGPNIPFQYVEPGYFSPLPLPIASPVSFVSLAQGGFDRQACALSAAGDAYCWSDSTVAVKVSSPVRFTTIAAGGRSACGLDGNGQAYCWGSNFAGQLGTGTTQAPPPLQAVPVATDQRFVALVLGAEINCAISIGGFEWCWGGGRTVPAPSIYFSDWFKNTPMRMLTAVTFNGPESCGIALTGRTYCSGRMGEADNGVLFTQITGWNDHICMIDAAGSAYCRGSDEFGQLGMGGTGHVLSETRPILGGLHFLAISAGSFAACGVTFDFVLYCWGSNNGGQAGQASLVSHYSVPQKVLGQP